MKFSRFYESVLILIIIFLFIRLVVTSGNLITLSQAEIGLDLDPTANTIDQINHPELLIGPVDGNWTKSFDILNKLNQSTRVTTNFCLNESEPLVPTRGFSASLDQDGIQSIKSLCYPIAIFKIQNGLMYIEGEIIN